MALSILLTDIGSITSISKFCLLDGALGADANGNSSDDINIDNTNNASFPASGPLRSIFVEGEEIGYTSKGSSTQFTTITRGLNNTNIKAHANDTNVTGVRRYALKADSFGVSIQKTPIQIAFPQNSPELLELGMFRPSITLSGTVDRDQSNTPEIVTGPAKGHDSDNDKTNYFVPTQKQLEDLATDVIYDDSVTPLQLIVQTSGGATYATYDVAINQCRFDLAPGTEDRYQFSMSFVGKDRQES
tara:strand:- start:444 stop:1178 length:735 start_codon:yes stop_codon:yes gene_type:complete